MATVPAGRATLPGRINGFVRWVVRTPWPVFSLSMLQADIIGALFVLGFLRYGLPPQDRIQLQDLPRIGRRSRKIAIDRCEADLHGQ